MRNYQPRDSQHSVSGDGSPNVGQVLCARLSKDSPSAAGQSGSGWKIYSYQPRSPTHSVSGDGNSNVGLSAALQDAEKRDQSAYQSHHAQEPAEGDSARSSAAPEAQCRLKNCAVSTA